jgi:hypothetical protein
VTRVLPQPLAVAVREALLVAAGCAVLAVLVNLVHPRAIPLVAEREYEILVPCPEPGGEAEPIEPGDPLLAAGTTFVVDARPAAQARSWRYRDALNIPYDYLDPTPEETLQELARSLARSRARRVVVYGDGDNPDTGEQLAREISGRGIKNVGFVRGGAPALRRLAGAQGEAP